MMKVEDYTDEEIEEDLNAVDWDYADKEVMRLEEIKLDKLRLENQKKLEEEARKIEEELKLKYEQE